MASSIEWFAKRNEIAERGRAHKWLQIHDERQPSYCLNTHHQVLAVQPQATRTSFSTSHRFLLTRASSLVLNCELKRFCTLCFRTPRASKRERFHRQTKSGRYHLHKLFNPKHQPACEFTQRHKCCSSSDDDICARRIISCCWGSQLWPQDAWVDTRARHNVSDPKASVEQ